MNPYITSEEKKRKKKKNPRSNIIRLLNSMTYNPDVKQPNAKRSRRIKVVREKNLAPHLAKKWPTYKYMRRDCGKTECWEGCRSSSGRSGSRILMSSSMSGSSSLCLFNRYWTYAYVSLFFSTLTADDASSSKTAKARTSAFIWILQKRTCYGQKRGLLLPRYHGWDYWTHAGERLWKQWRAWK